MKIICLNAVPTISCIPLEISCLLFSLRQRGDNNRFSVKILINDIGKFSTWNLIYKFFHIWGHIKIFIQNTLNRRLWRRKNNPRKMGGNSSRETKYKFCWRLFNMLNWLLTLDIFWFLGATLHRFLVKFSFRFDIYSR